MKVQSHPARPHRRGRSAGQGHYILSWKGDLSTRQKPVKRCRRFCRTVSSMHILYREARSCPTIRSRISRMRQRAIGSRTPHAALTCPGTPVPYAGGRPGSVSGSTCGREFQSPHKAPARDAASLRRATSCTRVCLFRNITFHTRAAQFRMWVGLPRPRIWASRVMRRPRPAYGFARCGEPRGHPPLHGLPVRTSPAIPARAAIRMWAPLPRLGIWVHVRTRRPSKLRTQGTHPSNTTCPITRILSTHLPTPPDDNPTIT